MCSSTWAQLAFLYVHSCSLCLFRLTMPRRVNITLLAYGETMSYFVGEKVWGKGSGKGCLFVSVNRVQWELR